MTMRKARLTVTVDRALVRAATEAVAAGQADSLSGWVNLALAERAEKDRRLRAMEEAVADYEREHGVITSEEIAWQQREDRRRAIIPPVRPRRRTAKRRRRRA